MSRKRFSPTPEQLRTVEAMAGFGIPHEDIAYVLSISVETLGKYCAHQLRTGKIRASVQVAQTLFRMATGVSENGVVVQEPSLGAAIFWTKAQMGWREKHPEGGSGGGNTYVLQIER